MGPVFLYSCQLWTFALSSWGSVMPRLPRSWSVLVFPLHLLPPSPLQALKDSKVVEIVEEKVRRREEPEKWPLPGPPIVDYSQTDFSQLLNCPEFVPRQHYQKETGRYPAGMWMPPCCPCLPASSPARGWHQEEDWRDEDLPFLPFRVCAWLSPCSHPSANQNRGGQQPKDAAQGPVRQPPWPGFWELDWSEEKASALSSATQGGWGLFPILDSRGLGWRVWNGYHIGTELCVLRE